MKKIGITLLILAIYSTSAWSQMGGGMMDRPRGVRFFHRFQQIQRSSLLPKFSSPHGTGDFVVIWSQIRSVQCHYNSL